MRKFIFQIVVALLFFNAVNAQDNGIVVRGKWADQVSITDVNGRPFENIYENVNGTPYFNEKYKLANIKLNQGKGRTFAGVQTRIDLVTQQVHFISSNGVEGFLFAGMVKEVTYEDTTTDGIISYKFLTGFPAVDKQTDQNFYLVLSEGRCSFLKSIVKKVNERKNELSGEVAKDLETYEDYYFYVNGFMKRWKKDKDFVLAELADKQKEINQYVLTNKVNFKNADQVAKLVKYYNSL